MKTLQVLFMLLTTARDGRDIQVQSGTRFETKR